MKDTLRKAIESMEIGGEDSGIAIGDKRNLEKNRKSKKEISRKKKLKSKTPKGSLVEIIDIVDIPATDAVSPNISNNRKLKNENNFSNFNFNSNPVSSSEHS